MGVLTIRLVEARGAIMGVMAVHEGQELMIITQAGTITRTPVTGISRMGRATQGVIVQRLRDGDQVASIALVADPQEVNGEGEEPPGDSLLDSGAPEGLSEEPPEEPEG
jgi:DNA gyrase subunit A